MKFITYFLPQFYPTPENDKYWGKGFTDWDNVKKAKPLFKNHKQPILPLNNDFYDLSDIGVLERHCAMSINNGIDGFAYWHYWFDTGHKTLEKVQEMHLAKKEIKQKFFFAWANTDWTKSWVGDNSTTIFKQKYTIKSAENHFKYLKQFIEDERYILIENLPVLQVLNPDANGVVPYILELEKLAKKRYGKGFYWLFPSDKSILGLQSLNYSQVGFPPGDATAHSLSFKTKRFLQKKGIIHRPVIMNEKKYLSLFKQNLNQSYKTKKKYIPCVLSGWDNTPRYNNKGFVIQGDITTLLTSQLKVIRGNKSFKNSDNQIVLVKAWNEWAEGNVLEPYFFEKEFYPLSKLNK